MAYNKLDWQNLVGRTYYTGTMTPSESGYTSVDCGFAPSEVMIYRSGYDSNEALVHADFTNDKYYLTHVNGNAYYQEADIDNTPALAIWVDCIRLTSNGFEFKAINSTNAVPWNYMAIA